MPSVIMKVSKKILNDCFPLAYISLVRSIWSQNICRACDNSTKYPWKKIKK
jgi:hypothetical protein